MKTGKRSTFADIHPEAIIHPSVEINAFVTIEKDVVIDKGCWIGPNAIIMEGSRIGSHCKIFPGAVIGSAPQDLKYKGEKTQVYIGDRTVIREYVTVNKGTASKTKTLVDSDVLVMAYSHIGHDCEIGRHVVISNNSHLAGEVHVEPHATISAGVLIHQFSHIGEYAMIQGGTKINKDIPPFVKVGRERLSYLGINSIGLRRNGYDESRIQEIQKCYRYIFNSSLNTDQAITEIQNNVNESTDRNAILGFIIQSKRGIIKKGLVDSELEMLETLALGQ